MFYRSFILIVFSSLCMSACANKHEREGKSHNTFTPNIHADGSKRFTLAINYERTKRGEQRGEGRGDKNRSGRGGEGGGRREQGERQGQMGGNRGNQQGASSMENSRKGNSDSDANRLSIIALLDEKLAETKFCRHGYIELDYSQMPDKTEIVGECQESASDEDRKQWR